MSTCPPKKHFCTESEHTVFCVAVYLLNMSHPSQRGGTKHVGNSPSRCKGPLQPRFTNMLVDCLPITQHKVPVCLHPSQTARERFLTAAGSLLTKLPLRMSAALLSNNIVSGRVAMLGFAYALIGEILDGKGLLAQIGYDTTVEHGGMDGFFLFVVSLAFIS